MPPQLHELARCLVAAGRLPNEPASKSYGGTSLGGVCALCSQAIQPRAAEIELIGGACTGTIVTTMLHPACHAVWIDVIHGADHSPDAFLRDAVRFTAG